VGNNSIVPTFVAMWVMRSRRPRECEHGAALVGPNGVSLLVRRQGADACLRADRPRR
jgi:hypothetical protein